MGNDIMPNEEVIQTTTLLEQCRKTLDKTDVEHFDKEDIRAFVAMCNEVKLSAVKVLRVLDEEKYKED